MSKRKTDSAPATAAETDAKDEGQAVVGEALSPTQTEEAIEAILFAAGHAVPYAVLSRVLNIPPAQTKAIVYKYAQRYGKGALPRGVMLLTYDDSCQLCTKEQYLPYIREALGIRRNGNLSNSSIETLAIIAYNQPVTRSYVDTVRGVDSSYAIGSLLERNLIESKGRLDAPGRPMQYGTTPDFLRCFGLSSLTELPGVSSEEAAEMLAKISQQMEMEVAPDENQITIDESAIPPSDAEQETAPGNHTPNTEETTQTDEVPDGNA